MEIEKMGTNILFEFFHEGKKERDAMGWRNEMRNSMHISTETLF